MKHEMNSYRGNPALKQKFLELLQEHADLDMVIKGTYGYLKYDDNDWESPGKWQGCAVACSVRSLMLLESGADVARCELDTEAAGYGRHRWYAERLGIPVVLTSLEDALFERMSSQDAATWPVRFGEALPVGKDLSKIFPQFMLEIAVAAPGVVLGEYSVRELRLIRDYFTRQLSGEDTSALEKEQFPVLKPFCTGDTGASMVGHVVTNMRHRIYNYELAGSNNTVEAAERWYSEKSEILLDLLRKAT